VEADGETVYSENVELEVGGTNRKRTKSFIQRMLSLLYRNCDYRLI